MAIINQKEIKKINLSGETLDVYAFAKDGKMLLCDSDGNIIRATSTSINSGLDSATNADANIILSGLAEVDGNG